MQEELERKEINYARGKVAGNDVLDEDDEIKYFKSRRNAAYY